MIETSIKTKEFGLKPLNYLIFINPTLKGWVMDSRANQGFSPNELISSTFLY